MLYKDSYQDIYAKALAHLDQGFSSLSPFEEEDVDATAFESILLTVAERLRDNYPYRHPLYAGQMLKPPHSLARLAYSLALHINPNNHALDGGRASSAMEKEAVAHLAKGLLGWERCLGHLSSGGTFANLEALWIGHCLRPGQTVLASAQAHYTHQRLCQVLAIPFETVAVTSDLRLDIVALEQRLAQGDVGMVVATLGTTGAGMADPLPEILALQAKYGFRLHVDAAYGGYFSLIAEDLGAEAAAAFALIGQADSVVIDPHKHGLQPYGCGAVFFRDPQVGRFYQHDSPYTYFSSEDLHLGEISLECSRAGAAAVALWATLQYFPAERNGLMAARLRRSRQAALALYNYLAAQPQRYLCWREPQTDIVLFAPQGSSYSEVSARSRAWFKQAADLDLHLALIQIPASALADLPPWQGLQADAAQVTCLRSCLLKPEHLKAMPQIQALLDKLYRAGKS